MPSICPSMSPRCGLSVGTRIDRLSFFTERGVGETPFRGSRALPLTTKDGITRLGVIVPQRFAPLVSVGRLAIKAARIVQECAPVNCVMILPRLISKALALPPKSHKIPGLLPQILESRIFLVVGLALVCGSQLFAAVHPVPLDPKADPSTCLQCHEDKSKGKAVHSAIAMGCTTCHEIRVTKDVTRIKLTTTTTYGLCFTCHADKDPSQIKGSVHPPAVRDCVKCHDPHTADNKNQLLKATSGDKKDNLCLSCHTEGLNVPEKGSRHAALDGGCETCHVTHKTGAEPTLENRYHLTKGAPALCMDCHDVKDAALIKAHQGQPFGAANCLECHDPHQSAQPKLMAKFVHPPFADKDGKAVLTQANVKDLCVTCHSDKAELIEKAKVQHPGAAGDCTDCHTPHASGQPGLPKTDPVSVCLTCHSDQADQFKKAHLHQPVFKQSCAICHEPHGSENEHLMRTKKVNDLCLECHGPDSPAPKKLDAEHMVTIFNGAVKLPEDYFKNNKAVLIPVKFGRGHPTEGHPIVDVADPADITKVHAKIDCMSCHQPHSSAQPNLLIKDQADNLAFCTSCHKDLKSR
jgi:predicted CXXCH cytochrome family protein